MQNIGFKLLAAVAIAEALAIFHILLSAEIVVLSEASSDGKYLAQVSATREFPYLTLVTYLTVKETAREHTLEKHLLFGADAIEDVVLEVRSLKWKNGSVAIDSQGSHYVGPKVFDLRTHPTAAAPP
jgi:hypothetical protein